MEAVERSVSPFLEGEFVAVLITSIWMTIIQLVCVRLPQTHLFFSLLLAKLGIDIYILTDLININSLGLM